MDRSNYKYTCVVGIGNSLRSDDGAGHYVCDVLQQVQLPNVDIISIQQPDPALVERLVKYEKVIFVDASLEVSTVLFQPVTVEQFPASPSFSHQITPALLAAMAKTLYGCNTRFYTCAIGAYNFEMGDQLSEQTLCNANDAAAMLREWLLQ